MTRYDFKRYKKIRAEIAQLHQDLEDAQECLYQCCLRRDDKAASDILKNIQDIHLEISKRDVIGGELLLPKYAKLENGYLDCLDFWKDNDLEENNDDICEYISMFLTDEYNHDLYGFDWVVKGKDIYVTSIRWNEHQLLACDIKDLLKGKIEHIDVGEISLRKNPLFTNGIFVLEKGKRCGDDDYSTYTKKEVIKLLEERYLI